MPRAFSAEYAKCELRGRYADFPEDSDLIISEAADGSLLCCVLYRNHFMIIPGICSSIRLIPDTISSGSMSLYRPRRISSAVQDVLVME